MRKFRKNYFVNLTVIEITEMSMKEYCRSRKKILQKINNFYFMALTIEMMNKMSFKLTFLVLLKDLEEKKHRSSSQL